MKKSELLKMVLVEGDFSEGSSNPHLCTMIGRSAKFRGWEAELTAFQLRMWISEHLNGRYTVDAWLHLTVPTLTRGYDFNSAEMMEYRRLWLIDMIAYWESKGE